MATDLLCANRHLELGAWNLELFLLPPPPLTLLDHPAQVHHRPYLKRPVLHAGMFRHQLNRVIQIPRFEEKDSTDLLFRLRIRPVGNGHLAILPPQSGRVPMAIQRLTTNEIAVLPQHIIVFKAFVHHRVSFLFGQSSKLILIVISKANVFHKFSVFGLGLILISAEFSRAPSDCPLPRDRESRTSRISAAAQSHHLPLPEHAAPNRRLLLSI